MAKRIVFDVFDKIEDVTLTEDTLTEDTWRYALLMVEGKPTLVEAYCVQRDDDEFGVNLTSLELLDEALGSLGDEVEPLSERREVKANSWCYAGTDLVDRGAYGTLVKEEPILYSECFEKYRSEVLEDICHLEEIVEVE